ncbi:MAG: S-layer homology domain-containing protein [Oscillospiraceae bacterium]|nr:S-layer homology domain-containing protein [Oscillospiraceae bacterium]
MKRLAIVALALLMLLTVIVTPAAANTQDTDFEDVTVYDWFFSAVRFVSTNGIMNGTSSTTFAPHANFSRAMVVTTLFRIYHDRAANQTDSRETPFNDVQDGDWFAPYVSWAAEHGIVTGHGDHFAPNDNVDRQQFATMLFRFADTMTDMDTSVRQGAAWAGFADRNQIQSWATDALMWANYHGFITGRTTTTIVPTGNASRAEAATILMRFLGSSMTQEEAMRAGIEYSEIVRLFPGADVRAMFEQELMRLINEIRSSYGLAPLIRHSALSTIARGRADEMIRHNSMSHVSPTTGLAHTAHANNQGLNVFYAGENAGWGHGTPQDMVTAWMESPVHRDGILVGAEGNRLTVEWATMPYAGVGFASGDTHEWGTAWTFWIMTAPR